MNFINSHKFKIPGWEDTFVSGIVTDEQQTLIDILTNLDMVISGKLPMHSYGREEDIHLDENGMRFLNILESQNLCSIDWYHIFGNAGEASNNHIKNIKKLDEYLIVFLDVMLERLKGEKLNFENDFAIRLIFNALSPVFLKITDENEYMQMVAVYSLKMRIIDSMIESRKQKEDETALKDNGQLQSLMAERMELERFRSLYLIR